MADDRTADESQPNPQIKQKVDLTADETLPNPLRFGHTERQVAGTCCRDMSPEVSHTKRQC